MTDGSRPAITLPRPRLALRLGVVGHRVLGDAKATASIRQRVDEVLDQLALLLGEFRRSASVAAFHQPGEKPLLHLLTSLAEGADQLVASAILDGEQARTRVWDARLTAILPASEAEFLSRFAAADGVDADDYRNRFHALVSRAEGSILTLDGATRVQDDALGRRSYEAAARTILGNADLLLAVWNGEERRGRGGTEQSVEEAGALGVPVIWIHADRPEIRYVDHLRRSAKSIADGGADDRPWQPALQTWLSEYLATPSTKRLGLSGAIPEQIFEMAGEPDGGPGAITGSLWPHFRNLLARPRAVERHVAARLAMLDPLPAAPPQAALAAWDQAVVQRQSAADRIALLASNQERSAIVATVTLGALSISFAAFSLVVPGPYWVGVVMAVAELACLVAAVLIFRHSRRRRWGPVWRGYRLLAEVLRPMRHLAAVGVALPARNDAGGAHAESAVPAWAPWYYNASLRELGPRACDLSKPQGRLDALHALRRDLLRDQFTYHIRTAERMKAIAHWLEFAGIVFFCGSVIFVLAKIGVMLALAKPFEANGLLLLLADVTTTVVAPTFAAAFVALREILECQHVERRSEDMAASLSAIDGEVAALTDAMGRPANRLQTRELARVAERIFGLMIADSANWAAVFDVKRPVVG